jgi:hypothetical protein
LIQCFGQLAVGRSCGGEFGFAFFQTGGEFDVVLCPIP